MSSDSNQHGALADRRECALGAPAFQAGGQISGCDPDVSTDGDSLAVVRAGWPEPAGEGVVALDPATVLRATPRSFALRVRGQSMIGAGIQDGDIVIGEFRPEARPGAVVVALLDGESVLKRLVLRNGRPQLVSENPNCPDPVALSELVIQGVACMLVRGIAVSDQDRNAP